MAQNPDRDTRHVDPSTQPVTAAQFAELARALANEVGVEPTLRKISALALDHIDGCEHAAVTLVKGQVFTTRGATSWLPPEVDRLQYQSGTGPSLDAIRVSNLCVSTDLAAETRWPHLAKSVAERLSVRAMMSVRLSVHSGALGALNLYSSRPGAFGGLMASECGSIFAAHAAVPLRSALEVEQLHHAMDSRGTIGVAIGLLMAHQRISKEMAFDILCRASQRLNKKVRHVAADLAEGRISDEGLAADGG